MNSQQIKEDNHKEDIQILLNQIGSEDKKKGVIHIGAHLGEEVSFYLEKGFNKIILIEANPNTYKNLSEIFAHDQRVECYNNAISQKTEACKFRIYKSRTNNTESSSILPFDEFDKIVPTLTLKEEIEIQAYSLPDFIEHNKLKLGDFNLLVLDIQGADYLALSGARSILSNFDYIITELNYISLYKDSKNDDLIKQLLKEHSFRVKEEIVHTLYKGEKTFPAWGEAIFLK